MLVLYGLIDGWPDDGDVFRRMRERAAYSPSVRVFSLHSFDEQPGITGIVSKTLMEMIAAGRIKPHIHARLPLAEASTAHAWLEDGSVMGKVVLQPHLSA